MTNLANTLPTADAAQLYRLKLYIQRRVRRIRFKVTSPLEASLGVFFYALARKRVVSPSELANELGHSRGRVSQQLQQLSKLGLIISKESLHDRRARDIRLSSKGERILVELRELNNALYRELTESLSEGEKDLFGRYLRLVTVGLGGKPEHSLSGEEPLVVEFFNVAQAMGQYGESYLQSGASIEEHHVLLALDESPVELTFKELAEIVPVKPGKLVTVLQQLQDRGFISRVTNNSDKRSVLITITPEGQNLFESWEAAIGELYRKLTASLSQDEIKAIVHCAASISMRLPPARSREPRFSSVKQNIQGGRQHLHGEYVHGEGHIPGGLHLVPPPVLAPSPSQVTTKQVTIKQATIKQVTTKHQWQEARAFYIEQLVRSNRHHSLDERVLPEDGICILFRGAHTPTTQGGSNITALLYFSRVGRSWTLSDFISRLSDEAATDEDKSALVITGLHEFFKIAPRAVLTLSHSVQHLLSLNSPRLTKSDLRA